MHMYTSLTHLSLSHHTHTHKHHTQVLSLALKSALVGFTTLYLLLDYSLSQTSHKVMGSHHLAQQISGP